MERDFAFLRELDLPESPPSRQGSTGAAHTIDTDHHHQQQQQQQQQQQPAQPATGLAPTGSRSQPTTTTTTTSASTASASARTTAASSSSRNAILVGSRQRGNPMLKHVRNVPWEYVEQIPDYVLGQTTCALFLSIRYHNLHPEYIHGRFRAVGQNYRLRILLCLVDVKDNQKPLQELARLCVVHDYALVCAWSNVEAARYLELFKAYEHKSGDALKERPAEDFLSQMAQTLTSTKAINKTDAMTLVSTFGNLKEIAQADADEIRLCPGFGEAKVQRFTSLFTEPFVKK